MLNRSTPRIPGLVRQRLAVVSTDTGIEDIVDETMAGEHGTPCIDALLSPGFFESNRQAIAALIVKSFSGKLGKVDELILRNFLDDAQEIVRENLKTATRAQNS